MGGTVTRGGARHSAYVMNDSDSHTIFQQGCTLRGGVALVIVALALALPQAGHAAGCADWVQKPLRATGTYFPAEEVYARSFVFAMLFDCNGSQVTVTVQRPTGRLPVCEAQQQVEVEGMLSVSSRLIGSYYQIIDPARVTCLTGAQAGAIASKPPAATPPVGAPPVAASAPQSGTTQRAEAPRMQAKAFGPTAWVGRYTDSRGTGDLTVTLIRGESTVSGSWMMRTGGGGPLTGTVEPNTGQLLLRLENIAAECPGLLEGSAEIAGTTFTATYHGHDCQGPVTGGRLELRQQ
jgi:hypothetical protein